MNKAKTEVPKSISILQPYTFSDKQYHGLTAINGPDGTSWTVGCRAFTVDPKSDSKTQVLAPGELQTLLLAIGRDDVFVEVETIRTTKTGKFVHSGSHTFEAGTNIGKSNETSVLQAAIVYMQSLWRKMNKAKAVSTTPTADTPTKDSGSVPVPRINPMLLGLYKYQSREEEKSIGFPCFVQRKYDGLRCIAVVSAEGEVVLQSRGQCTYTNLKHINVCIQKLMRGLGLQPGQFLFLDGELYSHGLSLQKINSLIKNETSNTLAIQLRVFDGGYYHTPRVPFSERLEFIRRLIPETGDVQQPVLVVPTLTADSPSDVDRLMQQFIDEKYEGAVLRTPEGAYVFSVNHRRSDSALKYKKRDDLEVQVIGFSCGQGRDQDAVVFTCSHAGSTFNVVLNTTIQTRKSQFLFLKSNDWAIDCLKNIPLTIEYSGLSDSGVPQQPRGKLFRFDLAEGVNPERLQEMAKLF